MGASGNVGGEEPTKLSIGRADTGGAEVLLEVIPYFLNHSQFRDSDLDRRGKGQGDVTKRSLGVIVPVLTVVVAVSGLSGRVNEPLALGPEIGLHRSVPLLPVGTSENGNHFVKSTGHGDILLGQQSQQVNATADRQEKKKHLSANESTSVNS